LAVDGADHWINKAILDATKIFSEGSRINPKQKAKVWDKNRTCSVRGCPCPATGVVDWPKAR